MTCLIISSSCCFCAMDNAKPSLYTGPCRGRCRNRPQWVKAAVWQKQEGALGPPGPSPMPADLQKVFPEGQCCVLPMVQTRPMG